MEGNGNGMLVEAEWEGSRVGLVIEGIPTIAALKASISAITGVTPVHQAVKVNTWPTQLGDEVLLSVVGVGRGAKIRLQNVGSSSPPKALDIFISEPQKPRTPSKPVSVGGSTSSSIGGGGGGSGGLQREDLLAIMQELQPPPGWKELFDSKYGTTHPTIRQSPFTDTIRFAQQNGKIILVYLHNPQNDNTFPFCCGTLCAPEIASFINSNFVFWIGVLDKEEGANDESAINCLQLVSRLGLTEFPVLALVATVRGSLSILEIIQGIISPDEVLSRLMISVETHAPSLQRAKQENTQNDASRLLKAEQDEAYEQSLEEDRKKHQLDEMLKKVLQEAQTKKEELDILEKEKEQKHLVDVKAKAEQAKLKVGPEPTDAKITSTIVFRMPDGSKLTRKFDKGRHIDLLFDFMDGFAGLNQPYELVSNFPKRTFLRTDTGSLQDVQLAPQAVLFVKLL